MPQSATSRPLAVKLDGATGGEMWRYEEAAFGLAVSPDGAAHLLGHISDPNGHPVGLLVKLSGALAGKRIVVRETPVGPRLVANAMDRTVLGPSFDGLADPTLAGAVLTLSNPGSGETATIPLPAANWRRSSRPGSYTYVDSTGTCSKIVISRARSLVARCSGFAFSLDEPSQGTLAIRLTTGTGPTAVSNCMRFGGTIVRDQPGAFVAKASAPTLTCP